LVFDNTTNSSTWSTNISPRKVINHS